MSKTWKELVESGEAELIDGKPSFKGDPETAMISNPTEKMAAWWAFKLLEDFNKSKPANTVEVQPDGTKAGAI